jgi:hypothetical protein
MPSFGDLAGIGFLGLVVLSLFALIGLKGAGGLILCVLIMTVLAGVLAKG